MYTYVYVILCMYYVDLMYCPWPFQDHRVSQLEELTSPKLEFLWLIPSVDNIATMVNDKPGSLSILQSTLDLLGRVEHFEEQVLKDEFHSLCKKCGVKMKTYMELLRKSLSEAKVCTLLGSVLHKHLRKT